MAIFDSLRHLFSSKQEDAPADIVSATGTEEIWKITDQTDFLIALNDRLNERSQYGDHIERLSAEEQIFYICNLFLHGSCEQSATP